MIQRIIRYLFVLGALTIATFVVLGTGSYRSMLPHNYDITLRIDDKIKAIKEKRTEKRMEKQVEKQTENQMELQVEPKTEKVEPKATPTEPIIDTLEEAMGECDTLLMAEQEE